MWRPPPETPFPVDFSPFYQSGQVIGLGVEIHVQFLYFGVPIHLLTGTTEVVTGSLQLEGPYTSGWTESITYVLPLSDDQGNWSAYVAGAGSPYPLGGLLLVQTP
jgi:hypothetical protein